MPRSAFAGTRIRERRMTLGLRQSEVALRAGISGSYLNLIEHNRRRIGGKLLLDLAKVLETDSASLAEGGRQPAFECVARCSCRATGHAD